MRSLIPTSEDKLDYARQLLYELNKGEFLNQSEDMGSDNYHKERLNFNLVNNMIENNLISPTGNKSSVWIEELKQNILIPEFRLNLFTPDRKKYVENMLEGIPFHYINDPLFENEGDALEYVLPEGPRQNYYNAWYDNYGDEIENNTEEWNEVYDRSPLGPNYDPDSQDEWQEPYEEIDTFRHLAQNLNYEKDMDTKWLEFVDLWNNERDLDVNEIPWDKVAKEFFLEQNIIQHEIPDMSYWMRDESPEFNQQVKVIIPPFEKNVGGGTDIEAEYVLLQGENDHPVIFSVRDFKDFKEPWTTDFWEGTKRQRKEKTDRKAVEEKTFGLDLEFNDDFYKMQKQLDGSDFDQDSIKVLDDKYLPNPRKSRRFK